MQQKQNLNFEQVKSFDLLALQKAFEEGRLYIVPSAPSESVMRQEGIRKIMEYVSRIDECASTSYTSHIRDIWQALLSDPTFSPLFFLTRYQASRGKVNWYRVNVLICLMREYNIYQYDRYTGLDLHLRCERATSRNTHYTCMNRYQLERQEMKVFRRILQQFNEG